MAGTAKQRYSITTDETRNVAIDFSGLLGDGETLSGTPIVLSDANIDLSNKQTNSVALVINNVDVGVGEAVQFTVANAAVGRHIIEAKCGTSAGQTVEGKVNVDCVQTEY